MSITPEEVLKVAKLAKLCLTEAEVNSLTGDISVILSYMRTLEKIDTADVPPLYSPDVHEMRLRPDVAKKEFSREEMLASSAEHDGEFFIVPRII